MPRRDKPPRTIQLVLSQPLTDDSSAHDAHLAATHTADLRRVHRRDIVERVIERAQVLPPQQRAMVEGIYLRQLSAAALSREMKLDSRCLRRDVRAIVHRVLSPIFPFVVRHRDTWTGQRRQVARLCYIEGMSLRAAAHRIGISFHKVRRHDEAIRFLFEAFETARRRAS